MLPCRALAITGTTEENKRDNVKERASAGLAGDPVKLDQGGTWNIWSIVGDLIAECKSFAELIT